MVNRNTALEADLTELRRLAKLRKMLELPAELYERHAPQGCSGECEHPTVIGSLGLTCCHFYYAQEMYNETKTLERVYREKVDRGRSTLSEDAAQRRRTRRVDDTELKQEYPRTFTGTYVSRKGERVILSDTSDNTIVEPVVPPEDDLKRA